jgi:choice-of-anchor A domain-containing protein
MLVIRGLKVKLWKQYVLVIPMLCAVSPAVVEANGLPFTLSPYNAFVFANFTGTSDYGGAIAAGGNLSITNASVATALLGEALTQFPGQDTLVAGGNLVTGSGTLAAGNAYGGGSSNSFGFTITNGQFNHSPTPDPVDFSTSSFTTLSNKLAGMASTGACVFDGFSTTTCTASQQGLNIIDVSDPTLLGQNRTVDINVAAGASVVINVAGVGTSSAPVYLTNYGIYVNGSGASGDATTAAAHNVLFNYYQAANLDISGVVGSLLAPNAKVLGGSGQVDGTLIASSFNGAEEFHNIGFEGTLPASAPEPMSLVLIGGGLLGIGLIRTARAE